MVTSALDYFDPCAVAEDERAAKADEEPMLHDAREGTESTREFVRVRNEFAIDVGDQIALVCAKRMLLPATQVDQVAAATGARRRLGDRAHDGVRREGDDLDW